MTSDSLFYMELWTAVIQLKHDMGHSLFYVELWTAVIQLKHDK